MTYSTKYRIQYTPLNDVKTYIDLKLKDYSGAVTDLKGGSSPLVMRMVQSGDKITEPLKATEVTVNVMSTTNFQFTEFFESANAKKWRVDIYKGNKATELLVNRDFQGSLDGWTPSAGWAWDKDTAEIQGTTGTETLTQTTLITAAGSHTCYVYYSNGQVNETLKISYNGVDISTTTLTATSGRATFGPFVVALGDVGKNLVLTKGTATGTITSTIRIKAISLLSSGAGEFGHDYNIFWKGFVQPDIYSEPLLYPPYETQINAIDGIGLLKNEYFDFLTTAVTPFDNTILQIIQNCLDDTEIYLPILSSINLYDTTMTDGDDPLTELRINQEAFVNRDDDEKNDDKQTVLDKLLRPFFARLTQANGYWNIERVPNKKDARTGYHYDWLGNELHDDWAMNDTVTLTGKTVSSPYRFRDQSQYIELERTWKNIPLKQWTGFKDSVVWGEFDLFWWTNSTTPKYWRAANTPTSTLSHPSGSDSLRITNLLYPGSFDPDTSPYWLYDCGPVPGSAGAHNFGAHKITITYKIRGYNPKNVAIVNRFTLYYEDTIGGKTFLTSAGAWTSSVSYIGETLTNADRVDIGTDWKEYEVESTGFEFAPKQYLRLRMYEPYVSTAAGTSTAGWVEYKEIRVKITAASANEYLKTTTVIDNDNWESPDDYEVYFGDIADYTGWTDVNKMRNYTGLLLGGSYQLTQAGWAEWGNTVRVHNLIHDRLKIDLRNQYSLSRHLLKATVYGAVRFNTVLKDTDNESRYFLPLAVEVDDKFSSVTGEWIELDNQGLEDSTAFFDSAFFDDTYFETV